MVLDLFFITKCVNFRLKQLFHHDFLFRLFLYACAISILFSAFKQVYTCNIRTLGLDLGSETMKR